MFDIVQITPLVTHCWKRLYLKKFHRYFLKCWEKLIRGNWTFSFFQIIFPTSNFFDLCWLFSANIFNAIIWQLTNPNYLHWNRQKRMLLFILAFINYSQRIENSCTLTLYKKFILKSFGKVFEKYSWGCTFLVKFRSSHQRCSIRKGVPRNFEKFTGKTPESESLF